MLDFVCAKCYIYLRMNEETKHNTKEQEMKQSNSEVARELNGIMGKANNVWIYCNRRNNLVIQGKAKNVEKSIRELCRFGLSLIKYTPNDPNNKYMNGNDSAEVGRIAK